MAKSAGENDADRSGTDVRVHMLKYLRRSRKNREDKVRRRHREKAATNTDQAVEAVNTKPRRPALSCIQPVLEYDEVGLLP